MSTAWERIPPAAQEIIREADPRLADELRSLEYGDPYHHPSRPVLVALVSTVMDRDGCGITKAVKIVAKERGVHVVTVWKALRAARADKRRQPLPKP